jgi:type IV pilus assembly protein PilO
MEKFLEQFAKIPFQIKAIALLVILVVIVGGNYFVIIIEKQSSIEELTLNIVNAEKKLKELKKEAADKERFEKEIATLKQKLADAEKQLPKKAEIPQLLRDIEYEAVQTGLIFEKFTPMGESIQGDFAHVPVKMDIRGTYHEVAMFLDRLAKMPRIVNATFLNIGKPINENKKIVMDTTFLATTYRYLDETERKDRGGSKKGKRRGRKR